MKLTPFKRRKPVGAELAQFEANVGAFADSVVQSLGQGVSLASFKGAVLSLKFVAPDPWRPVTFASGWRQWADASVGACAVRVSPDGVTVEARGMVENTSGALGPMVQVPTGFEPQENGIYPSVAGNDDASVIARPSGVIEALHGSTGTWFSLAGTYWTLQKSMPVWPAPVVKELPADFPGDVVAVEAVDAVDASGLHMGPLRCQWKQTTLGTLKALELHHVAGLVQGNEYTVTLLVRAA